MPLDEDTITQRVLQVGTFALVCATDADPRHRTVRVYDTQPGEGMKPLPDGSDLKGTFICSYYLSTLLARSLDAARATEGLALAGSKQTISPADWPLVEAWLRVMARS